MIERIEKERFQCFSACPPVSVLHVFWFVQMIWHSGRFCRIADCFEAACRSCRSVFVAMASSVASSMDCELLRMGSPWPWQLHSNESYESCDSHVIHRAKMNIDEQSASK